MSNNIVKLAEFNNAKDTSRRRQAKLSIRRLDSAMDAIDRIPGSEHAKLKLGQLLRVAKQELMNLTH